MGILVLNLVNYINNLMFLNLNSLNNIDELMLLDDFFSSFGDVLFIFFFFVINDNLILYDF